jgi:SAM-dependent methyltransferase
MKFFEPTNEWLDWLTGYARGRLVFDVGCGEGHVLRALHARRVRAIGIEPRWEASRENLDLCNAIIPVEAEDCGALQRCSDALVLFCRPCHSGFVDRVIRKLNPDAEVLYVSKPENVGVDIDLSDYSALLVKSPKCPEERVYRITRLGVDSEPRQSRRRPRRAVQGFSLRA